MKIEWSFNETSSYISFRKRKQEKLNLFRSFASRRSRPGQIFHSILIGFIPPVVEASLSDFDLSGIFGDTTIADCGITEFNDFIVSGECGNSPGR